MTLIALGAIAGGVGLFLLGMRLMTDGLRLAAGDTLRTILERSTATPVRGVLSGAVITGVAQSSSAVTVAIIGFVNAGLMELAQAIRIIYGSNVGTTVTGWIVAAFGLTVHIKALALPLIGIGMALRLVGGSTRRGGIGEALVGFGVFFLGVDVLKTAFVGIGESVRFESLASGGVSALGVGVAIGFALTLLMQSSSAAIAVILTAAAGGVLPLGTAAALVIGANVGTTSTAAVAVLGATPNAKRVAAAHIAFNVITGVVALLLLPLLLAALVAVRGWLAMDAGAPTVLALFHTAFNLLGVVIMLPLTARLVAFLQQRFRTAAEDEARPRYLDRTVVATPALAVRALAMELARAGAIARRTAMAALSVEIEPSARLEKEHAALDALVDAIGEFTTTLQRRELPTELAELLPVGFRVSGYYTEIAELARQLVSAAGRREPLPDESLSTEVARLQTDVVSLVDSAAPERESYSAAECAGALAAIQARYEDVKTRLLHAGVTGNLRTRRLVDEIERLAWMRRLAELSEKAARHLARLWPSDSPIAAVTTPAQC